MVNTATVHFPVVANFFDYEDGKDYARFLSFATGEKVSFFELEVPDTDVPAHLLPTDFNLSSRACYYFEFNLA